MTSLFAYDFVVNAMIVGVLMGLLLAYLGVHVVARGIVFVDLALGQISMMGVALAAFLEMEPTAVSVAMTLAGAFLLSLIKVTDTRLKQEAIIGIVYALASALTVLLISKAAHGDSDISEVLFGSMFTVTTTQMVTIGAVFLVIGVLHLVFRRRFFALTDKFASDEVHDVSFFDAWNFLFYMSIGLAIVLAVRIGGVIPVFAYIVIPPVSAILLTRSRAVVVALALVLAVVGSVAGIWFSVAFDFPAGSSVVAMLGALFVAASAVRLLRLFRAR